MATTVQSETQNEARYRPTTLGSEPAGTRSLSQLSSELATIEGLALAGRCDADHALEAVLRAIASLEQVSGVDVALAAESNFVSVASSGIERLAGTRDHFQVYADCVATGRLVRCADTANDPRAHAIPFSSMMVTPLSARGDLIGVLAIYSNDEGVFGYDHIVPLGTAAVICSFLASQVLETKMQLTSSPQSLPELKAASASVESLVESDGAQQHDMVSPELDLLTQRNSPPATAPGATLDVAADAHTRHLTGPQHRRTSDRDSAQHLAREEAIRSVLLKKPGKQIGEVLARRSSIDSALAWLRSPFGIVALLLLLSGFVFGSMQVLRRSGAAPSNAPKTAAAATRLATVTKLLGVPRAMRGNAVPADAQVTSGRLIQGGLPAYPSDALGRAVQGDVTAILLVSERGAVEDVRVTKGDTLLSNAVLSSLSHWRFAPFAVNGHAIAVELPVIVAFHINAETDSPSK